ncbi:MAG: hypothetical protein IPJ02_14640 [Chitinophagaceae bacterium]|nr:hypothetical protein [Chitinophagaceae bacterium]
MGRYANWFVAAGLVILFALTGWTVFYYQAFFVAGLILYDYFNNFSGTPVIKNKILYQVILAGFFVLVNLTNRMISEKFSDVGYLAVFLFHF